MLQFYINNTLVKEPLDLKDFKESILRDYSVRGLLKKQDVTLTFSGNGYSILHAYKLAGNFCDDADLIIKASCGGGIMKTVFAGSIGISNISFNLNKCTANCKIDDNSYSAKIFNNKNIKAYLNVGKSKNGIDITPCPTLALEFVDCQTGTGLGITCDAFDAFDVGQFLLQFMTDGTVGLISDWYTNLPVTDKFAICNAKEIRTQAHSQEDIPYISFEDWFNELNKKYKLFFSIETDVSGNINLRVEEEDYFFKSGIVATMPKLVDLIESFDFTSLYSEINLGSNKTTDFLIGTHDLPNIRYLTFLNEKFIIKGQCNIDRTLDLVSNWIIDSNIIQGLSQSDTANTAYDKDTVLVQYDNGTMLTTMWNNIFTSPPLFFNQLLTNDQVAIRWNVQGDLAAYVSNIDATFRASRTAGAGPYVDTGHIELPGEYPDDFTPPNYDTGGNYDPTPTFYRFTAPAQGAYQFRAFQRYNLTYSGSTFGEHILFRVILRRYNAANVLLDTFIEFKQVNITGVYDIDHSRLFSLDTGDYVITELQANDFAPTDTTSLSFDILGFFECNFSLNGGSIPANNDPKIYRILRYAYKKPISNLVWQNMKADPSLAIMFGHENAISKGWISKIDRNIKTSEATIELITDINNS